MVNQKSAAKRAAGTNRLLSLCRWPSDHEECILVFLFHSGRWSRCVRRVSHLRKERGLNRTCSLVGRSRARTRRPGCATRRRPPSCRSWTAKPPCTACSCHASGGHRYTAITRPSHNRYIAVTSLVVIPLLCRYIAVKLSLHRPEASVTLSLHRC